MPLLKKYCSETKKEHSKDINFCEDCRGERKAVLQPNQLIDLIELTLPSCITLSMLYSLFKTRS